MNERAPDPPIDLPASNLERLWTPWRMQYVGNGPAENGCVFCNRLAATDDVDSLILHRAERSFLIMNLFPYNTGHLMIVPNQHAASPEELDDETQVEMTRLLPPVLRAITAALNPGGFNVGMNLGRVAGAGIAAHMHQHVVPRWNGDANFMPILANTKVLPELIPASYAKIRAELERELNGARGVIAIALDPDTGTVLVKSDSNTTAARLPHVPFSEGSSASTAIAEALGKLGTHGYVAGWAGARHAGEPDPPALLYLLHPGVNPPEGWRLVAFEAARTMLDASEADLLITALDHLALDPSGAKRMSVHPHGL